MPAARMCLFWVDLARPRRRRDGRRRPRADARGMGARVGGQRASARHPRDEDGDDHRVLDCVSGRFGADGARSSPVAPCRLGRRGAGRDGHGDGLGRDRVGRRASELRPLGGPRCSDERRVRVADARRFGGRGSDGSARRWRARRSALRRRWQSSPSSGSAVSGSSSRRATRAPARRPRPQTSPPSDSQAGRAPALAHHHCDWQSQTNHPDEAW